MTLHDINCINERMAPLGKQLKICLPLTLYRFVITSITHLLRRAPIENLTGNYFLLEFLLEMEMNLME